MPASCPKLALVEAFRASPLLSCTCSRVCHTPRPTDLSLPRTQVSELERDLSAIKLELSARTSELGAAVQSSRLAEEEAVSARRDLTAANDELRSTKQSLSTAEQQLAAAAAAARELRRERDAALKEKKLAESTVAEARFQVAEAASARSAAEAAKMNLTATLAAAQEEVAEYQAQLAEREAALAAAEEALAVLAPDAVAAANGVRLYPEQEYRATPPAAPRSDGTVAAAARGVIALGDASKAPSTASTDSVSQPEPQVNARSSGSGESKPIVEMFADFAIEGARMDSILTNPAMGMAALLDFVNDWRGAISELSEATDKPAAPAPRSPAPAVPTSAQTPSHMARATIVTPDLDD